MQNLYSVDSKPLLKDTGYRSKWKKCAPPTSEDFLWNGGSQDTVTLSNEIYPGPEQREIAPLEKLTSGIGKGDTFVKN